MKKEFVAVLSVILMLSIFNSSLLIAETLTETDEIWDSEEFADATLKEGAGTTPDSVFYFLDEFFDKFSDEMTVREEKISEIKAMIEAGKIEDAHEALANYKDLVEKLEEEIDPERRDAALRSAVAIRNALKNLESQIPKEDRKDFVDDVIEKEKGIATAVEIASKIKELCVQLSEVDPIEYSKICKTKDDGPKWKKDLDKKLTKEQEEEAKKFGAIMKECFQTSGRECRCEDISFNDFSIACSKVAPLAIECDEGNEDSCDDMDEIEMPELPEHLQDIFEDIEREYGEDQFDMHMPRECVEESATTKDECMKVMFKINAPEECIKALEDGRIDPKNEREAREKCDAIMFEANAPIECIEEGIKNHKECGKYMFKLDAPKECIEAGLTGESKRDMKKCEEIMGEEFGPKRKGPRYFGPPGANCMKITEATERLNCFENAVGNVGNHYGIGPEFDESSKGEITWQCKENRIHWPADCKIFMEKEWPEIEKRKREEHDENFEDRFREIKEKERECANKCSQEDKAWDFYGGECKCYSGEQYKGISADGEWSGYDCATMYCEPESHCEPDYGCVNNDRMPQENEGSYEESECKDGCQDECPDADRTDCVDGGMRCECFYEEHNQEITDIDETSSSDATQPSENEEIDTSNNPDREESSQESSDSSDSNSGSESSSSESNIITGNVFLNYYYYD